MLEAGIAFRLTTVITLTTGTMFLMWLGEQITERGLGNGISLIIFAGIVSGLPQAIVNTFQLVGTGAISIPVVLTIIVGVVLVTYLVVFVERGQRKILVNYAKRQVGNKIFGGQTSHLPLKLNMAGVIPPIFASSIILFPATLAGWFGSHEGMSWLKDVSGALSRATLVCNAVHRSDYFLLFFIRRWYTTRRTDNLKKSGAFVPVHGLAGKLGIEKIMLRLTLVGRYITLVCLLPEFLILKFNVPFYFGGTSLLIIVVVTMDFMTQVQAYLMTHQYESLLKKANFKGGFAR